MRYKLGIIQRVYEETTVFVEAESPDAAELAAFAMLFPHIGAMT
jgi:hypothetical protein